MRRLLRLLLGLAVSALLAGTASAQDAPDPGQRLELWQGGVPGHEDRASIPEESRDYWTKSINNPSLRYFAALPERRTGAAVIIMPGGAHEFLVTTTEGTDVARWFAQRGVAAFVLSYRLSRQAGYPWTITDSRQDAERAVRLLRSRAGEFGIDPKRIGVMGFSAGGELARMTLLSPPVAPPGSGDAIDQLSSQPDFGILVFPGPLKGDIETITADSPPLLLSAANDDECCAQPVVDVFDAYRAAGASVELHMYAAGGHAYNMGEATPSVSLRHWPERIIDWMTDRGLLLPSGAESAP
ncbi:alpha/beta hydrolase [Citromicrobium bathyomarinum]|uniref:alpha/beta hydrolase n=1 Tax=Citromicrobium bathyomarinum TaxID=72174 RepID=UPI00315B0600